jgi:hypothetical protein
VHKCKMFMQEKEVLSERNSSVSMWVKEPDV